MNNIGTRIRSFSQSTAAARGTMTRAVGRDPGMAKLISASFTFVASSGLVTIPLQNFDAFAVGDQVLVSDTNLNDGVFLVTAVTTLTMTLSPPPKDEVVAGTIRTI